MLITGGAADYFDKRKIMMFADISRAIIVLLNGFVLLDIQKYKGFLYVILLAAVSCGSFFDPSREGFVPFLVGRDKLTSASAIDALTWMSCTFIGGSVGGLITSTLGYFWNFTFNSMTYLISALFVAQLFRFPELNVDELKKQ
jgi:MFS family permease